MDRNERNERRDRVAVAGVVVGLALAVAPIAEAHAAVFVVGNHKDDIDADLTDGKCNAPGPFQKCTLRAAIMQANAIPIAGSHVIVLESGTSNPYTLTRLGAAENLSVKGDLDVRVSISIVTDGPGAAVIEGSSSWNDRLFQVHNGATLSIQNVILQNGSIASEAGGALRVEQNTTLLLSDSTVQSSNGEGGGCIFNNNGTVHVELSTLQGCTAAGSGGAIFNRGTLILDRSQVLSSQAGTDGGCIFAASDGSTGATPDVSIVNSTLRTCRAGRGGGIFNQSTLELDRATIVQACTATNQGGGIFNAGTIDALEGSILDNRGVEGGGGVFNQGTLRATGRDSVIARNTTSGQGGGIFNASSGTLDLQDTRVQLNAAEGRVTSSSGGIHNAGRLTMQAGSLVSNRAFSLAGLGSTGTAKLTGTQIGGNEATSSHGGVFNTGDMTLVRVRVEANEAQQNGGVANFGTLSMRNSFVAGNASRGNGGGISNGGQLVLNNVTVVGNSAASQGGGLLRGGGTIQLSNTLVADNLAPTSPDCAGQLTSAGFNVIESVAGCTLVGDLTGNIVGVDPLLDIGQPTADSVALEAGNPAAPGSAANACEAVDFDGLVRPQDDDGDGVARCEIGAFEGVSPGTP
jgi:hypothetical protein